MIDDDFESDSRSTEKVLARIEQRLQITNECLGQIANEDSYYNRPHFGPRATLDRIENKLVDILGYARRIHFAIWVMILILLFKNFS